MLLRQLKLVSKPLCTVENKSTYREDWPVDLLWV